jgi:predicted dehydrogenase
MSKKKEVRLGIAGIGSMGAAHLGSIAAGNIKNARVTALCDIDPEQMKPYGDTYKTFTDSAKLIRSGEIDAILVATPHYSHTTIGADALKQGIHTLVEKPISVHKKDAEKLIAAHTDPKVVFSAMFNQRTTPQYIKLREVITSGQLGEITRVNWIITNWFRTQAYYDGGDWRATWKGEGGGVLLNQCPHNLDLMQWLFGMPSAVRAFCEFGKYHKIEVEDSVTAYLKYPNGATGVFITTTGEAPGTNRLEVCGENGKIVIEDNKIKWEKNTIGQKTFLKTSKASFARPETWFIDIPAEGSGAQHNGILQNFVNAILDGEELIAPAEEGINSVELANAMIFSSLKNKTVQLPLNSNSYATELRKLIAGSKVKKTKTVRKASANEMASSFNV